MASWSRMIQSGNRVRSSIQYGYHTIGEDNITNGSYTEDSDNGVHLIINGFGLLGFAAGTDIMVKSAGGAQNGKGYRMIRDGYCIGSSFQFTLVDVNAEDGVTNTDNCSVFLELRKRTDAGGDTSFFNISASGITSPGEYGDHVYSSTTVTRPFDAGDQLYYKIVMINQPSNSGILKVKNFVIFTEIVTIAE
tara:strand:- start:66 stop:641 length:576 start_codon:yes stop_codon:yes gene_type:complete